MRKDYLILEELLDVVEQLGQRLGSNPERGLQSSSRKLREEIADFADSCRRGELEGQSRKRRSGELFRRILTLHPDIWTK